MSRLSVLLSSNLPSQALSAQQKSYVTYSYASKDSHQKPRQKAVTLLEARSVLSSSGTTGLRTWEAALHLGSFLTTPAGTDFVKNKDVLELGAGTGFLSILSAKHLGATRVIATDGDPGVVESLDNNLFLNGLEGTQRAHSEVLKWGRSLLGTTIEEEMGEHPFDVVLGADLVLRAIFRYLLTCMRLTLGIKIYDKKVVPSLLASICDLVGRIPSLDVIIAATVRNGETVDIFTTGCGMFSTSYFDRVS